MKNKIQKIKWLKGDKSVWLKQRNELLGLGSYDTVRFGSSEVATVLNISPYESKLAMFHRKRGFYLYEKNSLKMTVGGKIEPLIADIMESYSFDREQMDIDFTQGIKHRKLKNANYFLTNSKYPFFLASIDYITDSKVPCIFTGEFPTKGIVWETKNPAYMAYKNWENKVPDYYIAQCQQQLAVSDFDKAYLAVLAGSDYPDLFLVEKDEQFIDYMDNEVSSFGLTILKAKAIDKLIFEEQQQTYPDYSYIEDLKGMLQELEPDVDGKDATKEFLEQDMYPESNTLEKQGNDTTDILCDRYLKALKLEVKLKDLKTAIRNELTANHLEDFETLKTESHKVTNRRSKSGKNYFSIK